MPSEVKLAVTYLQVTPDPRGGAQFHVASKLLTVAPKKRALSFSEAARRVAAGGFLDADQHVWIAPGAIMLIKERAALEIGRTQEVAARVICPRCSGSGSYRFDSGTTAICTRCRGTGKVKVLEK